MISSYTKLLHLINLEDYESVIKAIESNIQLLDIEHDEDSYPLLSRELSLAKHKLKTITPPPDNNRRRKRGIFNWYGKLFKKIGGNMDNDDAIEIYSHLKNLDENGHQMTDQLNKQVTINNDLIENLNSVVEHVNEQESRLSEHISNITERTNNLTKLTDKLKYTLQIYADTNLLNKQLERISDIILMSKLNVLPHDILTEKEINKYNISLGVRPFIKNCVLLQNRTLIFVISLPNFTQEKYYNALIIPIPNDRYEELDFNIEKVIIQGNNVFTNEENIITKKDLRIHANNCIRNVFQTSNVCRLRINNQVSVERLDDGLIVTKNLPVTYLVQNC